MSANVTSAGPWTIRLGRMEGEGPERFWAMFNQNSGSTSEQGPGVRTDEFNNIIRAWNEGKAFTMCETLPAQYEDAKKELAKVRVTHDGLTTNLPQETIKNWENESIEPVKDAKGNWNSPMMDPIFTGGFYETVQEERKKEDPTGRKAGRRPGVVQWLSDGIELEHAIHNFNESAEELGDSPTSRKAENLNTRRLALRDRITNHQKKHELFMADGLVSDNRPELTFYDEDDDEPVELGLPSSYKIATMDSAGLSSVVEVEKEPRRALCKEALQSVKTLLASRAAAFKAKDKHARGQNMITRARAGIKAHNQKIDKARWRYNNSFHALTRLGLSEKDAEMFEVMSADDCTPLKTYFDNYAAKVGQKGSLSWIWRSSAAPNREDWEIEALKAEWFRSREHFRRRREHLILLKREMVMTIRSFLRYQELWEWKASSSRITPGMKAYAHGRAKFFYSLAHKTLVSCQKALYDNTVELKWCNAWLRNNVIVMDSKIDLTGPNQREDWIENRYRQYTIPMSNGGSKDSSTTPYHPKLEEKLFGVGGYKQFSEFVTRSAKHNIEERRRFEASPAEPPITTSLGTVNHLVPTKRKSSSEWPLDSEEAASTSRKRSAGARSESPTRLGPSVGLADGSGGTSGGLKKWKARIVNRAYVDLSGKPTIPRLECLVVPVERKV